MAQQIRKNLWQVGGDGITGGGDAAYLLSFGDEAVLIDAGTGSSHEALVANIDASLPDDVSLAYTVLTHCHYDHTGGAAAIRAAYGCKLVAHARDAVYLESGDAEVTAASWYGAQLEPLPVDIKLSGSRNIISVGNGELMALHWPGHSPGSMVLTTQIGAELILFGQDVHGPIHPSLLSDMADYQVSLQALLDLDADLLLEGHFGIIEGRDAVSEFIRSFML